MGSTKKPTVYFTSSVFFDVAEHKKVSREKGERIRNLKKELENYAKIIISSSRFPEGNEIAKIVKDNDVDFVVCHLSHPIIPETMSHPSLKAVITSTAGYNHIAQEPGVIITHTPSVLDKTVADFTIAVILSNLRNLIDLHNFVWDGKWKSGQKWDLDENLNMTIDNRKIGIVGLGEIGRELVRRLAPWGIDLRYYDIYRNEDLEKKYSNLHFVENVDDIFSECDIVSLHVPLNKHTKHLANEERLKKMKNGALLVNTARGPVVDFEALLKLLENNEISIDLSFDVYDPEPLSEKHLEGFKKIKEKYPERRFIFIPHNASADADTRAQMAIIVLEDVLKFCRSQNLSDISSVHFIPEQRFLANLSTDESKEKAKSAISEYRISKWWRSISN